MLGRIIIDRDAPDAHKQYLDFKKEVMAIKEKNDIPLLYILSREFAKSSIEIVVLAASDKAGDIQELKNEGFSVVGESSDINSMGDIDKIKKGSSEGSFELDF